MKEQAQKVMKAFYKDDTWDKEPLPGKIVVANVLRQTINELQQSPGVIMCADVLELCEELEAL